MANGLANFHWIACIFVENFRWMPNSLPKSRKSFLNRSSRFELQVWNSNFEIQILKVQTKFMEKKGQHNRFMTLKFLQHFHPNLKLLLVLCWDFSFALPVAAINWPSQAAGLNVWSPNCGWTLGGHWTDIVRTNSPKCRWMCTLCPITIATISASISQREPHALHQFFKGEALEDFTPKTLQWRVYDVQGEPSRNSRSNDRRRNDEETVSYSNGRSDL